MWASTPTDSYEGSRNIRGIATPVCALVRSDMRGVAVPACNLQINQINQESAERLRIPPILGKGYKEG